MKRSVETPSTNKFLIEMIQIIFQLMKHALAEVGKVLVAYHSTSLNLIRYRNRNVSDDRN